MRTTAHRRAFTLIELLVVIGLIAVLAGGIGVAMMGGNSATSLQNSQNVIGSLVSVARSKSALTQASSAVLVNVTPGAEGFLREFRVAVLTIPADGTGAVWVASADPTFLDKGVYYVVPSAFTAGVDFPTAAGWTANIRSTAFNSDDVRVFFSRPPSSSDTSTRLPDTYRFVQIISALGGVVRNQQVGNPQLEAPPTGGGRVVLAPAKIGANDIVTFDSAAALRGLLISSYGVATFVNEPEAFKP